MLISLVITPGFLPVLALLIFVGLLVVERIRGHRTIPTAGEPSPRQTFVARIAVWGSLALLVGAVAITAVPYVFDLVPFQVRWWDYVVPLALAAVVVAIVLGHVSREPSRSVSPVAPVLARTWLTFMRPRDRVIAGLAFGVLVVTCVAASLASIPDPNGQFAALPIGPDGGLSTFFGWAYSLPVLVGAAVLAALVFWALRVDALRPFSAPETVDVEVADRRETSRFVLGISSAAITMTLGRAWVQIGDAGLGQVGVGIPGIGDFMWSAGFSSFAPFIVVCGGVLTVGAFVYLLLTARRALATLRSVPAPIESLAS